VGTSREAGGGGAPPAGGDSGPEDKTKCIQGIYQGAPHPGPPPHQREGGGGHEGGDWGPRFPNPIALAWGMGHVHKLRNGFRNVAAQRERWVATLSDLKRLLEELTIRGAGRLVRGGPGNMSLYNDAVLVVSFNLLIFSSSRIN